jgi:hypothetical protein
MQHDPRSEAFDAAQGDRPCRWRARSVPASYALLVVLVCGSGMALGCTTGYSLGDLASGDLEHENDFGDSVADASRQVLPMGLAAPDVTWSLEEDGIGQVSAVGDLDGDGFADFALAGQQSVHVRYGGARPQSKADAIAWAESGVRLTIADPVPIGVIAWVAPAGDVDGDGYDDMLVQLMVCTPALDRQGAYLLYGGPERLGGVLPFDEVGVFLKSPRIAPEAEGTSCTNSDSVAGLGDIDGDGFGDFALVQQQELNLSELAVKGSPDSATYLFYGRAARLASGASWPEAADARIIAHQAVSLFPTGDSNADGFADLILGSYQLFPDYPANQYWLPGSAARASGDVELSAIATVLDGVRWAQTNPDPRISDLDGDGVPDVFLRAPDESEQLFYGRPGLFDTAPDLAAGEASYLFRKDTGRLLFLAGDRNGDGAADLLAMVSGDETAPEIPSIAAYVDGSRERLSGAITFPAQQAIAENPGGIVPPPRQILDFSFAGDLDGDGATDLFSVSQYEIKTGRYGGINGDYPELHIHYGTPLGPPVTVR